MGPGWRPGGRPRGANRPSPLVSKVQAVDRRAGGRPQASLPEVANTPTTRPLAAQERRSEPTPAQGMDQGEIEGERAISAAIFN